MLVVIATLVGACLQARQLESLIRLAEARARLELAQTVTAQHAKVNPGHGMQSWLLTYLVTQSPRSIRDCTAVSGHAARPACMLQSLIHTAGCG